ncbi:diphthine methyltransferase [Macadamia integrifolia]|uniref:diphthine methyltransferase n=1 Tax=Macadamia integrifolia TaxID=60698 RepID=UPI001C4E5746|nr:diphthine methyltransferase [Macadamia integrifolia]XP_042499301.1 diphthine methyltransferase [Macadamia integrifolia]XP_042499302.1 diphthine methyltransferase [Macadamia integrifolia]
MDVAHCYLDGNADAVEFCPHHSFNHLLAASTYTLQEGVQPSRSGSISLFSVDANVGSLDMLHRVETAGIFDIKWSPIKIGAGPLLAQADADGYLRLHGLEHSLDGPEARGHVLKEVGGENVSSSMCLCLDWNASASSISLGISDGSISVVTLGEAQLQKQQAWQAHEFEVWATSFDIYQPQLLYSGSDDCKFCCWDLRENPSKLVFQNSSIHKMGVCCIANSSRDCNTLLTGSYDEYLRVWDLRSISKPLNENAICLGGGVWRIKQHPSVSDLILAACMHNGFAIVKVRGESAELVETYVKHDSLAYGADWQCGGSCDGSGRRIWSSTVATCSFYDRLLRIWLPETQMAT